MNTLNNHQPQPKFTVIHKDEFDALECLCGNRPERKGFYPCNSEGEMVEPTLEEWTTHWYVCDECGRIIDYDTSRVVGCRFDTTLTFEERMKLYAELDANGYPRYHEKTR
jgi:hypothetical protein